MDTVQCCLVCKKNINTIHPQLGYSPDLCSEECACRYINNIIVLKCAICCGVIFGNAYSYSEGANAYMCSERCDDRFLQKNRICTPSDNEIDRILKKQK